MKKPIISLALLATLASCNSNGNKTSEGTNEQSESSSNSTIVESTKLFADLKADYALANQNYMGKTILVKGLLAYDGYIDTLQKRCVLCVPIDEANYKMGFLYRNDAQVGEHFRDYTGFWNPEEETDKIVGRVRYTLNGQKLGMLNDKVDKGFHDVPEIIQNRITMSFEFEDANDYTKLKLPTQEEFREGTAKSKAIFYEIVDIEGTVVEVNGGKDRPSYISVRNCKLVNQRQPAAKAASNEATDKPAEQNTNTQAESNTNPKESTTVYYKVQDPDGYSNLRDKPNGDVIKKVYESEQFEVIASERAFKKIKLSDGTIGYIHASRVVRI